MTSPASIESLESRTLLSTVVPGAQFPLLGASGRGYDLAADAQGNLFAARTDADYVAKNVYVRRFDKDGHPLGGETQANQTVGTLAKINPQVAVAPDGRSVVAWSTNDTARGKIVNYLRRFDANGQPLGSEIQIQAAGFFTNNHPVAMDDQGNFVLVYENERGGGRGVYDINAQRFNSAGQKVGKVIQVDALPVDLHNTYGYFGPGGSVDMDAAGNFVVSWNDNRLGTWNVMAQRIASDGTKLGGNFQVNNATTHDQAGWNNVAVGLGGDSVITWTDYAPDMSSADVYVQRYDAQGNAIGAARRVNDQAGQGSGGAPDIGRDGTLLIDFAQAGGSYVQVTAADGTPIDVVQTPHGGLPVMQANGEFILAWDNGGSLVAQKFYIAAAAPAGTLDMTANTDSLLHDSVDLLG